MPFMLIVATLLQQSSDALGTHPGSDCCEFLDRYEQVIVHRVVGNSSPDAAGL